MSQTILFHVGMHKTGTTWLQNTYFANNSNYHLLNNTQAPWTDFLCKNVISPQSNSFDLQACKAHLNELLSENKVNVLSAERFSGHPISGGYDMEQIASRLNELEPSAKILIVTREAHSFIASCYRQAIVEGYSGKLNEFLKEDQWKTAGRTRDYFEQRKILLVYRELFGEENVLNLRFEDFVSNKDDFLKRLDRFSEASTNNQDESLLKEIQNKSMPDNRLKALRCLNKCRKSEINPHPQFKISRRFAMALSKIYSPFYKKNLVDTDLIDDYLK